MKNDLTGLSKVNNELIDKFNTTVVFDEATNQFEVVIPEISASGCGDTKEEAINMVIDNVLELTEDYFENIKMYQNIDNMKKKYPFFMRIRTCNSKEDLLRILSIK